MTGLEQIKFLLMQEKQFIFLYWQRLRNSIPLRLPILKFSKSQRQSIPAAVRVLNNLQTIREEIDCEKKE